MQALVIRAFWAVIAVWLLRMVIPLFFAGIGLALPAVAMQLFWIAVAIGALVYVVRGGWVWPLPR